MDNSGENRLPPFSDLNPSFARVGTTRSTKDAQKTIIRRVYVRISKVTGGVIYENSIDPPNEFRSFLFLIYEFSPRPSCYMSLFPYNYTAEDISLSFGDELVHYEHQKYDLLVMKYANFSIELQFQHQVHRDFFLKSIRSVKDENGERFRVLSRTYRNVIPITSAYREENQLKKNQNKAGVFNAISALSTSGVEVEGDIISPNIEYGDWTQDQIIHWLKNVLIQPNIDDKSSKNRYEIISLHKCLSQSKKLMKLMIYLRNRNLAILLKDIKTKMKRMKEEIQSGEKKEVGGHKPDPIFFLDDYWILTHLRNEITYLKWNGKCFSMEYYNVLTKKIQRLVRVHKSPPDIQRVQLQLLYKLRYLWDRVQCRTELMFILLYDRSIEDFVWKIEKMFLKKVLMSNEEEFGEYEDEENETSSPGDDFEEEEEDDEEFICLGPGVYVSKEEKDVLWMEIDERSINFENIPKVIKEVQAIPEVRDGRYAPSQISFLINRIENQARAWKKVEGLQKEIRELGDKIGEQKKILMKKKKIVKTQGERLISMQEKQEEENETSSPPPKNKEEESKNENNEKESPTSPSKTRKRMQVILKSIIKRAEEDVIRIEEKIHRLNDERTSIPKKIEKLMKELKSLKFSNVSNLEHLEFLLGETRKKTIQRLVDLGLESLEKSGRPIDTNVKLILSIANNRNLHPEQTQEEHEERGEEEKKKKKKKNEPATEEKILRSAASLLKGVIKDREWFRFGFVHVAVLIRSIKLDWYANGFCHFEKLDLSSTSRSGGSNSGSSGSIKRMKRRRRIINNKGRRRKENLFHEIFAVDTMCPHYGTTTTMMRRKIGLLADIMVHYNSNVIYEDWHIKTSKLRKNCQEFAMEILRAVEASQFFPEVWTWFREVRDLVIKHLHDKDPSWIHQMMFMPKSSIPRYLKRTFRIFAMAREREKEKEMEDEEEEGEEGEEEGVKKKKKKKKKKKNNKKKKPKKTDRTTSLVFNEKFVFQSHEELDEVVIGCRRDERDFEMKYPGINQLLKGFDRAFWIRKLKEENTSDDGFSSDLVKPLYSGCPFGKPFRERDISAGGKRGIKQNLDHK